VLAVVPFCGVFGFNAAFAALYARAPVIVMDVFDVDEALALIAHHGITHLFGSDDMGNRLQEKLRGPLPTLRRFGFASFVSSAEDFGIPARERGLPVIGLYGSSEVQALFSMQDEDLGNDQIVQGGGRPAGDTAIRLRVRDTETGELLPDGQAGELEIQADSNFAGYLDDPEATAAAIDAEGFFHTGDLAYLRGDGSFVYLARLGDAMRLGGFLVSPVEIESQLIALPGVASAQVVEIRQGDRPGCAAFVIPEAGAALDVDALRAGLRERLAAFKLPARIWVVDAFPVTQSANGTKVQRAALRRMAAERLAAED
jgi:fatty-acyl-CoA synthase